MPAPTRTPRALAFGGGSGGGAPSGAAGGSLSGTYPNPGLAAGAVGSTELAANAVTLAKMATQATLTLLGNATGGTAVPTALSASAAMALLSGGAGADFSMNSHKITNQLDPTAAQDSATKAYVDKKTPTVAAALTDAATVAWNVNNGQKFTLLATSGVGNTRALGDPSGTVLDGLMYHLIYTQDGTGGRALTVSGTGVKIATALGGGTTIPLDTTASAILLISLLAVGTTLYVTSAARLA